MAQKEITLTVPMPVEACYKTFEQIGQSLADEFKLDKAKPPEFLEWKRGFTLTSNPGSLQVNIKKVDSRLTEVRITANIFGLIDGPGNLPKMIQKFEEPFRYFMIEVPKLIQEGLMCPTCFTPCAAGTKFCPRDGTRISNICRNCNQSNPPSNQFCSNCGTQLF